MDNPDTPCETVLSDDLLLDYLHAVREKTLAYLDSLTDDELNDCPENCEYTRLELILMQFRHISVHTGMLNGQTIERTSRFPVYVGPTDSAVCEANRASCGDSRMIVPPRFQRGGTRAPAGRGERSERRWG